MVQSSLIAKLLTSSIQTTAIQVVPRKCLRSRLNSCECKLCVDLCPNNALFLDGNTITVSEKKCQGCMLCSTICPNDALSSSFDILALVINHPRPDAVTYTCHLQQQYIDNEVVLPCLAALSAEALLYLCLAEKSSPILLDAKHCSNCHNQKSFQIFKQILDKVSHIIKELANSSLVLQTEESGKPEPSTRRVFLKSIKNVISTQKRNQHKTCTEEDGPSSSRRAITIKITLVNAAANHVSPSQRAYFSRHAKSSVIVNGECTPCNRCSGICPTGALELIIVGEVKSVVFDYKKCSGCGLCVAFCKLEALSLTASPISRFPLVLMEVQQS